MNSTRLRLEEGEGGADHLGGFVGADDVDGFGVGHGYVGVGASELGVFVFDAVKVETEVGEFLGDAVADVFGAFAYCSGEDDSVDATEGGCHLADEVLGTVDKEGVSEGGLGVTFVAFLDDLAHVVGGTGDAEEAGFFVEVFFELFVIEL